MAKEKKTNQRTKVKDLPKSKKELTKQEQKKVKGGSNHTGGVNFGFSDGSVRG